MNSVNLVALSMQGEFSDMPRQLTMFGRNLNVVSKLKEAMRESVRRCSLSRQEIVDEMLHLGRGAGIVNGRGTTISLTNLDAWLAAGKPNVIPLVYLPLFCYSVCDLSPLCELVSPLDAEVISGKDSKILAWARMEIKSKNLEKKKNLLLSEIARGGNE